MEKGIDLQDMDLENLDVLELSRRNFLKVAGALGAGAFLSKYSTDLAKGVQDSGTKLVWLSGAECAGCSISTLNSETPTLAEAVLGIDGVSVDVGYHEVIGYQTGVIVDGEQVEEEYNANYALENLVESDEEYLLVVEGSVQDKMNGNFLRIGGKPFIEHLDKAKDNAKITCTVGACAAWGGIPGAPGGGEVTGAKGVQFTKDEPGGYLGKDYRSTAGYPVINIPGCPVNPHWLMTVVVAALLGKLPKPEELKPFKPEGPFLDQYNRPKDIFGEIEHQDCTRRGDYGVGNFAETYSDDGCLWKLGCKAPVTYANCPEEQWHGGNSYCMESGGPCVGCTEPGFPEAFTPFKEPVEGLSTFLGYDVGDFAKIGGVVTAAGIAAHAIRKLAFEEKEEE
ncbi:MAG: NiFe-hydrogenase I small subunit HyaA [Candidatus Methanohalarchaeum thermophilum]|uniref:NiFe-hydrogenase I small subunit HyaA n=1 Tax=Methanohalarchaeum thermophilum TaxID=1903181 RepID=A0A1Q6DS11_METT1|nr:MAG: NiFe-hydrogenase I small subunit HyaA [Candidatus Methanohalarchaeum thermophilum]